MYEKTVFRGSVPEALNIFQKPVFLAIVHKPPEKKYTKEKDVANIWLKTFVTCADKTMFIDARIWGEDKCNAALRDLHKNTGVVIVGNLTTRQYTNNDGDAVTVYEVPDGLVLWTPKQISNTAPLVNSPETNAKTPQPPETSQDSNDEDDIPFK